MKVQLHFFVNSVLDGGVWSSLFIGRFISVELCPFAHWEGYYLGPTYVYYFGNLQCERMESKPRYSGMLYFYNITLVDYISVSSSVVTLAAPHRHVVWQSYVSALSSTRNIFCLTK